MAMMGSSAWNGQDSQMHQGTDDEFQQFLDMNSLGLSEGLQFDFPDFQAFQNDAAMSNTPGGQLMHPPPQSGDTMDTPMTGTNMPGLMSTPAVPTQQMRAVAMAATSAPTHASLSAMAGISVPSASMVPQPTTRAPPTPVETISEIDAKIQYLQQQKIQQQQRQLEEQQAAFFAQQSRMVPPTPQSLDIQAGNRFYSQPDHMPQQGMYERYSRLNDQDMAFTPLVSPAVTPLETQFPMESGFTIPGAYFSPLASPALHAQTETSSLFDKVSAPVTTSSPGDMDLETTTMASVPKQVPSTSSASADTAKKPRKSTGPKSRGKGNVRQSPISKPQRKKTATTPIMNAQALSELAETLEQNRDQPLAHLLPPPAPHHGSGSSVGATDSENGSVSPETLSDMPPPPLPSKPRSARPSPYIEPQNSTAKTVISSIPGKMSPATPASLMRLTSPSTSQVAASASHDESVPQEPIENFELPESVNFQLKRPVPPPLVTQSPAQSPSLDPGSSKGHSFQPLPSPGFSRSTPRLSSASQSPQLPAQAGSAAATPMTIMAATPATTSARKTPQLAPRGSKKRGSVGGSSVHVSPALRPRISPVIKPLLPGGASSAEEAASMLLASKSNYQNILEGNNVPGVSYPSELSTNLTSKRTSHKIAEQGRRNRINSALQEIAALLPATVPEEGGNGVGAAGEDDAGAGGEKGGGSGGGGDKKGGGAEKNSGPNSKASTVEMAIEYIKQLKKEVADATRRAEEAEKKLRMREENETEMAGTS